MNQVIAAHRRQFMVQHGGRESAITERNLNGDKTGCWLFPDGARMGESQFSECLEPPAEPVERLKLIVKYRETVLATAEQEFNNLKQQVAATFDESARRSFVGYLYNGTEEEALEALKNSRKLVQQRRSALRTVKAELEKLTAPPPEKARLKAIHDRNIAERKQKFADALRQIKI